MKRTGVNVPHVVSAPAASHPIPRMGPGEAGKTPIPQRKQGGPQHISSSSLLPRVYGGEGLWEILQQE